MPPVTGSRSSATTSTPTSPLRAVVITRNPRSRNNSAISSSKSSGSISNRSGSSSPPCPARLPPTVSGRRSGRTSSSRSGRADSRPPRPRKHSTGSTRSSASPANPARAAVSVDTKRSASRPVAGSIPGTKPFTTTESSSPSRSARNTSATTRSADCASTPRYSALRSVAGRATSASRSSDLTYRTRPAAGTTSGPGSSQSTTSWRPAVSKAATSRCGKPSGQAAEAYRPAVKYSCTASGSPARSLRSSSSVRAPRSWSWWRKRSAQARYSWWYEASRRCRSASRACAAYQSCSNRARAWARYCSYCRRTPGLRAWTSSGGGTK